METSDSGALPNNQAGGLMPKNARWRKGAILDFFDVGGADAADGHLDEQFMGADARDRNVFYAQIVRAAIDDGAHVFGDGKHGRVLTTDCRDDTDFLEEQRLQRRGAKVRREAQRGEAGRQQLIELNGLNKLNEGSGMKPRRREGGKEYRTEANPSYHLQS